jgi:hypothetical protein
MIVLFSYAAPASEAPTRFAMMAARVHPAYLSVYIGAYIVTQIDVCMLCWRHARVSPRIWLILQL